MLEQIISKMILDRACNVCGGIKYYRPTRGVKTEPVVCEACNGKGYMNDSSNATLFLTPHISMIPLGIRESMKQQNIYTVDTNLSGQVFMNKIAGIRFKRLYTYNVDIFNKAYEYARTRICLPPTEIHMYFD